MDKSSYQVPSGYKQTELGLIPINWGIGKIGKNASLKARIGWQALTTKEYLDVGTHYLVTGTDFINGRVNWSSCHYVDEWRYRQDSNIQLKNGDVLVTKDGTIGKVGYVENLKGPATLNSGVFVIRPLNNIFNPLFFFYTLNSKIFDNFISKITAGSTITHLYQKDFMSFNFPTPSLPEQMAIAMVLSDTDALIEHLEKLIDKKKAVKQGTMQQLLTGKKRLPGFSGEWKTKKLGDISDIKTGKKNNDDKISEGVYPFFVRSQQVERINSYSFEGEAILIPGEGNIGSIYHYINGRFDYHQRVYKISNFSEHFSGKFVYLSMTQNFNTHAMKNSVKATVDSLRLPTFQEFEILFPPTKEEQTAIANILSDMDSEIEGLEEKREKYVMIKQGMMQQLLTGKIRIYANN